MENFDTDYLKEKIVNWNPPKCDKPGHIENLS